MRLPRSRSESLWHGSGHVRARALPAQSTGGGIGRGAKPPSELIPASRCTRCGRVVAPPTSYCPDHPVAMEPLSIEGYGEVVSFTTLHSPPEGFSSPLHLALVGLDGGARLFCHGAETKGLRVGSRVAVEEVDQAYYSPTWACWTGRASSGAAQATWRRP